MPADKFIIVGFPRSRTGWLANLLTYGSCFCLHEGTRFGSNFFTKLEEIAGRSPMIRHIGNSDCGIPVVSDPADYSGVKCVVVSRNRADAERSYMKYFERHPYPQLGVPDADKIHRLFDMAQERLNTFTAGIPREFLHQVAFESLEHADAAERVWDFICPEEPFNLDRWETLNCLRVNPASEKVRSVWV